MFIALVYNPLSQWASASSFDEVGPYIVLKTDDPNDLLHRLNEGQVAIHIVEGISCLNCYVLLSTFQIENGSSTSIYDRLCCVLQESYTIPGILNLTQRDELCSIARLVCARIYEMPWQKDPTMFSLQQKVVQKHPSWELVCNRREYEPTEDNFITKLIIDKECTKLFDSQEVSYRQLL